MPNGFKPFRRKPELHPLRWRSRFQPLKRSMGFHHERSPNWWFFPTHLKNMRTVKLDHETPNRDEQKTCLSCHHPVTTSQNGQVLCIFSVFWWLRFLGSAGCVTGSIDIYSVYMFHMVVHGWCEPHNSRKILSGILALQINTPHRIDWDWHILPIWMVDFLGFACSMLGKSTKYSPKRW